MENVLLLADKYQVDHLREAVITILENEWPKELSKWDLNEKHLVSPEKRLSDAGVGDYLDEIAPCRAIALARRCDITSILPPAFYHLSGISSTFDRKLVEKALLKRDDEDDFTEIVRTYMYQGGRTASFELLGPDDWFRLNHGRQSLQARFIEVVESVRPEVCRLAQIYFSDISKNLSKLIIWNELPVLFRLNDQETS
ncbi:hypothetical protein M422DRAFT_48258 [Sphaerobolus stellatus SS14]|uniref:Uncharacterized protein n=1 Tax=Sphaerobolus stellatus (strain SS14) TaxID=990650 RepID=A0A0C9V676_SPHS4|nr:hypothetical protein M422DRAFT_48258 [Sphaerobolus stellatus SS14]